MLIANPIYDTVFKFLMEDATIARDMLEVILDREIESIDMKPIETATLAPVTGLSILRYDFKAVIVEKSGERKKVLIELQKAKHLLDIMRFRRYLGENYLKPDERQMDGKTVSEALDIITIYFLGFRLEHVEQAVLKSNNCYQDVLTGLFLKEKVNEPFVNLLDHEAYFIQLTRLEPTFRTRLEAVLHVFNQKNRTDDPRQIEYNDPVTDQLVGRMVNRLVYANSDEKIRRQLDAEEEVESKFQEKDRIIEQMDQQLEMLRKKLREAGIDPDAV